MSGRINLVRVRANASIDAPIDTGIDIVSGERFTIFAAGLVDLYAKNGGYPYDESAMPLSGPQGSLPSDSPLINVPDLVVNTALAAQLIVKIGTGVWRAAGRFYETIAQETGRIYLSINDYHYYYYDNRGEFIALVVAGVPDQPNHNAQCPIGNDARPTTNNPIEIQTGDKVYQATDIQNQNVDFPIDFTRYYRQSTQSIGSQGAEYSQLGLGWRHSHFYKLSFESQSGYTNAFVTLPKGGPLRLKDTGNIGIFFALAGSQADMKLVSNKYVLTVADKSEYHFESASPYRLVTRKTANNAVLNYSYYQGGVFDGLLSKVEDEFLRNLNFVYINAQNAFNHKHLWRVGDHQATGLDTGSPTGNFVEFGYSQEYLAGSQSGTNALLTSIRDVRGNTWKYEYYGKAFAETDTSWKSRLIKRISPLVDLDGDGVISPTDEIILESITYSINSLPAYGNALKINQQRGNGLQVTDFIFQPNGENRTVELFNLSKITNHYFSGGAYLGSAPDKKLSSSEITNLVDTFDLSLSELNTALSTPNLSFTELSLLNSVAIDKNFRLSARQDANKNPQTTLNWSTDGKLLNGVTDALGYGTNFAYDSLDRLTSSTDAEQRHTYYGYLGTRRQPSWVVVTKGTVANVITNGDMELNANWSALGTVTQQNRTTTQVDSGAFAWFVNTSTANTGIQSSAMSVTNGKKYVVLARVYIPSTTDVVKMRLSGETAFSQSQNLTTDAGKWQTLTLGYTATSTTTKALEFVAANNVATQFYVDSVFVLELDASLEQRCQFFAYDAKGRTLDEGAVDPLTGNLLQKTSRSYYTTGNGNGMLQTITQKDINGSNDISTTYEYDAIGRVVKTNQTSNFGSCEVSYTVYDLAGNVLASICNYKNVGAVPTTAAQALALFNPSNPTDNRVTAYEYDSLNRRVKTIMQYAEGGVTQQRVSVTLYDALSRVTRTIDVYVQQGTSAPGNWIWLNQRWEDGAGNPISHTNGVNVISDTAYNARGFVRLRRDALGNVALYGYDDADRLVKTVQNAADPSYNNDYDTPANPSGDPDLSGYVANGVVDQDIVTTQVYDANGNVLQTTDARGISTFTVYDALNRPVKIVQNAKASATVAYAEGSANYVAANDPRNAGYGVSTEPDTDQISTTEYDALGRMIRTRRLLENRQANVLDWEWDTTLFGYDSLGRQIKVIQQASVFDYDLTADPDLSAYTPSSNADQDIITQTEYDSHGRVLNSIDVNNRVTRYLYDGFGRQIRTIVNFTANGESPELWKWTASLGKWTKADGTSLISFGANKDENIISETVYDTDGRVAISRDVEGLEQRPAYDSLSRPTHRVQNFVDKTPSYEVIRTWVWESNVWKDKAAGATIQRGTGFDQNVIAQTTYDEQGRVQQTRDVRGTLMRMVYDSLGRRKYSITNYVPQGSSQPENWVFESGVWKQSAGGTAISFGSAKNQNLISATSYDRVGRVSSTRDVAGNVTLYLYDRAGRRVRTVGNYVPQGTSDPALWVYRAVNNVFAWRQSATIDTLITFGTAFDQNHISDTVYNKAGQVTTAQDGRGTLTAFVYDQAGRRLSSTLAQGTYAQVSDYSCYDKAGRVYRLIQNYQAIGSLSPDGVTIAVNGTRTWDFLPTSNGADNDENLISEIFYDRASRQVRVVNPENGTTDTTYRKDGLTLETLDPLGVKTVYRYDKRNRRYLVVVNYVAQGTSDPSNWVFEGGVWKQVAAGTAIVHGTNKDQNIIVKLTYDVAGRISDMQEPRGYITSYTYDRLSRRLTLKNPLNKLWTTVYSEQANAVQRVLLDYPNGIQTMTRDADPVGRLTQIQYDNPSITPTVTFAYDVQGQRTQMTENNGTSNIRITNYEYDQARRLSAVKTDTDGNGTVDETVSYVYDVRGNRTTLTLPGNLSVTYEYNARGQLRAMTDWSSQRHIFSFDKVGRHTTTQRPNSLATRYRYDRAGRIRQLRQTKDQRLMAQFDYEVDARGNRTKVTELLRGVTPSSTAKTYLYDNIAISYRGAWTNAAPFKSLAVWEGSLKLSAYASEFTFTYGTGPDHSIFDVYIGGTLWQSYDGYASTTGEKSETVTLNTAGVIGFEIRNRRDKNLFSTGYKLRFKSVVATVDVTLRDVQYTYDALARLLTANDGATNYTYGYDLAGNLTNNNGVTRVYNEANQMTQNGATSLTYLQNGNLDIEGGVQYAWDSANRLRNIGTTDYRYDGDGNRIRQTVGGTTTKYVFDIQGGLPVVLSSIVGTNTTRYVHSPRGIHATQTPTSTWEYPMQDGLGSVRGRIDANGAVLQSLNYSPYGVPDSSISGFAFTGEERDSNGFQYHRARYYNPQSASWLSQDIIEDANRYSYVGGNPINYVDKNGFERILAEKGDGGISGGVYIGVGSIGLSLLVSALYNTIFPPTRSYPTQEVEERYTSIVTVLPKETSWVTPTANPTPNADPEETGIPTPRFPPVTTAEPTPESCKTNFTPDSDLPFDQSNSNSEMDDIMCNVRKYTGLLGPQPAEWWKQLKGRINPVFANNWRGTGGGAFIGVRELKFEGKNFPVGTLLLRRPGNNVTSANRADIMALTVHELRHAGQYHSLFPNESVLGQYLNCPLVTKFLGEVDAHLQSNQWMLNSAIPNNNFTNYFTKPWLNGGQYWTEQQASAYVRSNYPDFGDERAYACPGLSSMSLYDSMCIPTLVLNNLGGTL